MTPADVQYLEAMGLQTLISGLTSLRHAARGKNGGWVDKFASVGMFNSFARFVSPDVNMNLSFTTLTLYSELLTDA